jgi:hypothetical protein
MTILTDSQREYEEMKGVIENNRDILGNGFIDLRKPQDSVGNVVWSIEDVRNYFPKDTKDEIILDGLLNIEKCIKESMTSIGYTTIEQMAGYMREVLDENEDED